MSICDPKWPKIKQILDEKKWTQARLADETGINVKTIGRWKKGENTPSRENLIKIAETTGYSFAWLNNVKYDGPKLEKDEWVWKRRKKEWGHLELNELYARIDEILSALAINKHQLVKEAGITLSKIDDINSWHFIGANPTAKNIEDISEYAGYNKDWLFSGTGQRAKQTNNYKPSTDRENLSVISESEPLPMVRHYRKLQQMDEDTLGEIQTWLNDRERDQPGFTGWFRLEFQNRFPEFDDWKRKITKNKSTGTDS